MKIPLTKGFIALVSDEDYDRVNKLKWHAVWSGYRWYAIHTITHTSKILLHRFILNPEDKQIVDHINGDGLDNRRENLRIGTQAQNLQNMSKKKNSTSRFKGVSWCKQTQSWHARISVNGKRHDLGRYKDEVEAADAYDNAAKQYFGEYAKLNMVHTEEIAEEMDKDE